MSYLNVLHVMCFCNHLLRVLSLGLTNYHPYKHFIALLAHTTSAFIKRATAYIEKAKQAVSVSYTEQQANRVQYELDQFYIQAVRMFLGLRAHDQWRFMTTLPFRFISLSAAWTIFHHLFGSPERVRGTLVAT